MSPSTSGSLGSMRFSSANPDLPTNAAVSATADSIMSATATGCLEYRPSRFDWRQKAKPEWPDFRSGVTDSERH